MEHPSPFTSCYGDTYFWHSWMTELLIQTAVMIFCQLLPENLGRVFCLVFMPESPFSNYSVYALCQTSCPLIPEVADLSSLQGGVSATKAALFTYLIYCSVKSNDSVWFVRRFQPPEILLHTFSRSVFS